MARQALRALAILACAALYAEFPTSTNNFHPLSILDPRRPCNHRMFRIPPASPRCAAPPPILFILGRAVDRQAGCYWKRMDQVEHQLLDAGRGWK